ncbi:MAG: dioxygenase [Gammaproteobacteria bacterium]|nr:dioxygenase [Gammaproteobacteria bacterium]
MDSLPAVFVSHGAPTLLIDEGPTRTFLAALAQLFAPPRAVLCISAHWETTTPTVSAAEKPGTIHDFYGFPDLLYRATYPAPGDPALADRVVGMLRNARLDADTDPDRGLDHGAWVPLKLAYPAAAIPVVQLSLQPALGPRHHIRLGQALRLLRDDGVLIIGSGGATHNLSEFRGQSIDAAAPAYVQAFDAWLEEALTSGNTEALVNYEQQAPSARRNHPTVEHFMPLFVALGAAGIDAKASKIHSAFTYGVLSMAAYAWE